MQVRETLNQSEPLAIEAATRLNGVQMWRRSGPGVDVGGAGPAGIFQFSKIQVYDRTKRVVMGL